MLGTSGTFSPIFFSPALVRDKYVLSTTSTLHVNSKSTKDTLGGSGLTCRAEDTLKKPVDGTSRLRRCIMCWAFPCLNRLELFQNISHDTFSDITVPSLHHKQKEMKTVSAFSLKGNVCAIYHKSNLVAQHYWVSIDKVYISIQVANLAKCDWTTRGSCGFSWGVGRGAFSFGHASQQSEGCITTTAVSIKASKNKHRRCSDGKILL